jgi:alpha-tubulin suppressor-like RCC1 family protein
MRLYRDVAPAMLVASVLALAIVMSVLGCREEDESPTGPVAGPALTTEAMAGALLFRQVSAGRQHTCGVTGDDRAYCWGFNLSGQLGDGTTIIERFLPVPVLGGLHFRHVNAGADHTCGVTLDNLAYCWGENLNGELGDGTTTHRNTPVRVAGGYHFRLIRAGAGHTCALTTLDVAYCWGVGGRLGDGANTQRTTPVRVLGGLHWFQLSAGFSHTCGVTTDNRAYCWGNNGSGELGDGTRTL